MYHNQQQDELRSAMQATGRSTPGDGGTSSRSTNRQKSFEILSVYHVEPKVKFTAICHSNECKLIVLSGTDFVRQFKNSLEKLV